MKHLVHLRDDWFIMRSNYCTWCYERPDSYDQNFYSLRFYGDTKVEPDCSYAFSSRRVTR